jgi:hypothetical protein
MQQLLAALQGNQAEINRFHGVMGGTVPVQEFYSPENIQRIIGAAKRRETFSTVHPVSTAALKPVVLQATQ